MKYTLYCAILMLFAACSKKGEHTDSPTFTWTLLPDTAWYNGEVDIRFTTSVTTTVNGSSFSSGTNTIHLTQLTPLSNVVEFVLDGTIKKIVTIPVRTQRVTFLCGNGPWYPKAMLTRTYGTNESWYSWPLSSSELVSGKTFSTSGSLMTEGVSGYQKWQFSADEAILMIGIGSNEIRTLSADSMVLYSKTISLNDPNIQYESIVFHTHHK